MAIGAICLLVVFIVIIVCDVLVTSNAKARTFDDVSDVPHNKVGLLLATSPITPQGEHNYYFDNRVKAADELYKAGKVDFIIASGGDYTQEQANGCDEPSAIRDSLVARGIPENRIVLDYDGTRTLNSIAKAREVYDLDSLTLISQKYHNERALYLADKHGLHAVGYNAAPSPVRSKRIKNTLREYLARVKMFIDVWSEDGKGKQNEDSLSFYSSFQMLDYKKDGLSNVERGSIMSAKSDILNARNLALVIYLSNTLNDLDIWLSECHVWDALSEDIYKFIVAKTDMQWETSMTGTAGSSYCAVSNYDMAIARSIFLESMIVNPYGWSISDKYALMSDTSLSNEILIDFSYDNIITNIYEYLNGFCLNYRIGSWRNKGLFDSWLSETQLIIKSLLNNLDVFLMYNTQAILCTTGYKSSLYLQLWLLAQLEQIIKLGDW